MPQVAGHPDRVVRVRRRRPAPRRFYKLMCGMAAALGIIVLSANLLSYWLDERVRTWPTAAGRVLSVEIRRDTIGVWSDKFSSTVVRERRFHLRYSYSVAGAPYFGTEIGAHRAAARVEGRPDRYAVGQAVTVHYNPSDPREAVLEAPFPIVSLIAIGGGLVLLLIAWHLYRDQVRPPIAAELDRDSEP